MKKTLTKLFLALSISLMSVFAMPQLALAADPFSSSGSQGAACQGIQIDSSNPNPCGSPGSSGTTIGGILKTIINIMTYVLGAVAIIMIIVGGFKYVTSGGNDQNVASAKNTIIYAIVGLVVVALAQVIIHFVLSRL